MMMNHKREAITSTPARVNPTFAYILSQEENKGPEEDHVTLDQAFPEMIRTNNLENYHNNPIFATNSTVGGSSESVSSTEGNQDGAIRKTLSALSASLKKLRKLSNSSSSSNSERMHEEQPIQAHRSSLQKLFNMTKS
jgi:hypothetical protein